MRDRKSDFEKKEKTPLSPEDRKYVFWLRCQIKSVIVVGRFNRIEAYNGVCPPWADYLSSLDPACNQPNSMVHRCVMALTINW